MAKTLQEQYKLLKEGKSTATDVFLKSAQSLFPQFVTNYATFDEAATILKQRGVINENFVGLKPTNAWESRPETDYETAYKKFLKEAEDTKKYEKKYYNLANQPSKKFLLSILGTDGKASIKLNGIIQDYPGNFLDDLKNGKIVPSHESLQEAEETKIKADSKKVAKSVEDALESNWDGDDTKNADNLNFNEILKGYNAERQDPKNADKTTDELVAMVLKNLSKDELFYVKNGEFGVKGLGYTDQAPGLKASKTDQMTKVDNPNSIANITKANTKDTTDKLPKSKIKDEMTYATKSQKGVAKMDPQGTKEKKIKLSETLTKESYGETFLDLNNAKEEAQRISQEEGVVQHVNQTSRGTYKIEDWYDADNTVASYENGLQLNETNDPAYIEPQITENDSKEQLVSTILDKYNTDKAYRQEVDKHINLQYTDKYATENIGDMLYDLGTKELEQIFALMPENLPDFTSSDPTKRYPILKHMNENKKSLLEGLYLGMGNSAKRNSLVEYYNNFIKEEEQPVAEEPKTEAKKKMPLADRLKEIEKQSTLTALEEKINALDEEIAMRNERLQVAEGEDISEFVSPSKLKELKKEIKELEKLKEKYNKELTKRGGKKTEMIDEKEELQESETGDTPIDKMSREELIDYLGLNDIQSDYNFERMLYYDGLEKFWTGDTKTTIDGLPIEVLRAMAENRPDNMDENTTQSLNESVDPFKAFKKFLSK